MKKLLDKIPFPIYVSFDLITAWKKAQAVIRLLFKK